MQSAKEKISDVASSAKEHADIYKAKVDEKMEKSRARTGEEMKIAEENRKAREAEAKMEMHQAKARHAADKLDHKVAGVHADRRTSAVPPPAGTAAYGHPQPQPPVESTVNPLGGDGSVPAYPLGSQYPPAKYL